MLSTTVNVIKSAVAADPTMTQDSRQEFVRIARNFRNGRFDKNFQNTPCAKCISYEEAAERLGGISTATVRRLRKLGKLTGVSLSGTRNTYGVTEESLDSFIKQMSNTPQNQVEDAEQEKIEA